jgi:transposase InsO family protein
VTVASFIASQRAEHKVPHVISCRALSVSVSWFYKWRDRAPTVRQVRRGELDEAVRRSFEASGRTYGSPRVLADLIEDGWAVSKKTVERSMAAQGLVARPRRRRHNLTRPDKAAEPIADLLKRDFTAPKTDAKWCGDLTEVPTEQGKLYLASVLDLGSRRVPGFSLSEHHDAAVATSAVQMAAAVRGGDVAGVIFHSDKGSEYTAELFAAACRRLGITQSMGRVGSCFDNAASESFNSTLEFELLSRRRFATRAEARREVAAYMDRYNTTRRHSSCEMRSPVDFEAILASREAGDAERDHAA